MSPVVAVASSLPPMDEPVANVIALAFVTVASPVAPVVLSFNAPVWSSPSSVMSSFAFFVS